MPHSRPEIRRVLRRAFVEGNPHESFQDWVSTAFDAVKQELGEITDAPGKGSTGSQVISVASELWSNATDEEGVIQPSSRIQGGLTGRYDVLR